MIKGPTVAGEGFGRLARLYPWIEWVRFGGRLQSARIACLDQLNVDQLAKAALPRRPRVLFLGDGDGRLLEEFAVRVQNWDIISVDISQRMLESQMQRLSSLKHTNTIRFLRADSRQLPLADKYELVISAFHLDCFRAVDLGRVVDEVHDRLVEDGCLYVVDFVLPDGGWHRLWAKSWIALFVSFFRRFADYAPDRLPDYQQHLCPQRWSVITEQIADGWISTMILRRRTASAITVHESEG